MFKQFNTDVIKTPLVVDRLRLCYLYLLEPFHLG
jgi:hypothetical protein